MKNFFKVARVSMLVMVCALFLGIGIKAEAASGKVEGLKQTNHSYTAVKVEWKSIEGVDIAGYKVEWCADKSFTGDTYDYGYVQNTEAVLGPFASGKSYWVRVSAARRDSENKWQDIEGTESDSFEAVTAPISKVSNLKQTKAEKKKITLSWKKATGGANAYVIDYFKKGSEKSKQVKVGDVNSCTLSSLAADTKYGVAVYTARKSASGYVADAYDIENEVEAYVGKYMSTMLTKKVTKVKFLGSGSDKDPKAGIVYFSWNQSDAADGYEYTVYGNSGNKLFTKTTTGNRVIINDKKLKNANQFMKIKVKAYINVNGGKKYAPPSDDCWFAKEPLNVKASKLGRTAADGVRISWKKMTGAKNYTVYITTTPNSNGSWKKAGTITGSSLEIKKCAGATLTPYVTYYYKVIANKKVGKKMVNSDDNWERKFWFY